MKRISLILALILIASCLGCALPGIAFAASETIYTTVLEDLQKDETFDVANYPAKDKLSDNDKVMDVIQIAESNAGELFLYVSQPMQGKFTASEVRISQSIGDNLAPQDCKLTLLSRDETLEKYKVEGLQVKSDAVRYYLIVQLARPWNVDGKPSGNEIATFPYPIEKLFTVSTADGKVTYTEKHSNSIEIVSKYVGNLRYYNDGIVGENYTTSHYVAFSTEVHIDKIYEVDVFYIEQNYIRVSQLDFDSERYKELPNLYLKSTIPCNKTLRSNEYDGNNSKWEILTHTWNTIQTKDAFVASEKLNSEAKKQLLDKQWVLRFTTTDFHITKMGLLNGDLYDFTDVSEVTILRLKFLYNGRVYNLGVVDNKQTGGSVGKPDNGINGYEDFLDKAREFFDWLAENWWVIIAAIVIIALIVSLCIDGGRKLLGIIFKAIGKGLWWFIKYFAMGLFYIVTCPYWIIRAIVLAAKKRKQ